MLSLIRKDGRWFARVTAAAALLRLFFIWKLSVVTDDSLWYGSIANCLLRGQGIAAMGAGGCRPTLSRLPGYPAFLAFSFWLGGADNYRAAMLLQVVFDLLTCFLVADVARRVFSQGPAEGPDEEPAEGPVAGRAARWAFLLAAFCPFLMNYVAAPLTECLEIFCLAAALDCALIALAARRLRWWTACGACCAAAILLRPDGGLMLGAIGIPVAALAWREAARRRELVTAMALLAAVSLAPLAPWTVRNWRLFHVFQPLVTPQATDPGDFVPGGWGRWLRGWVMDYANVEDVTFQVDGVALDPSEIPERAYSSPAQKAQVLQLVDQYNVDCRMTPELDRQFGELAEENIRLHPLRYHVLLPVARMLDMWLRPRTELMPLDTHFWRFDEDPHDSLCALALAALNFAYVAAAAAGAWAMWRGAMRRRVRWSTLALLLCYPIVRSLFLATTGTSEDRYTMECFPFVFVLAAGWLSCRVAKHEAGRKVPQDGAALG